MIVMLKDANTMQCPMTRGAAFAQISIAHPDRDPSWDEIATARYRLLPDVEEMVMPLPALAEYVNHHQHCFHLVEHKTRRILLPHEF